MLVIANSEEQMVADIIVSILKFLFYLFIEVICFYTGEIILSIISWGKKKPKWDYYADASGGKFVIFTEISTWIGMAFWIFIIGILARALLK